jgi:NADH:ubiquinone oxidoreductase subunit 6 (subunit J)
MGSFLVWVVFVVAALSFVGSGVAVISFGNPFYSALALIGNLASLAVFYLLLAAEFLAAAQVLVYAGAVMVMFLFVIAYLGGEADPPFHGESSWQILAAVTAGIAVLCEIFLAIGLEAGDRLKDEADVRASFGSPAEVGRVFLTDHLLAFEITSIVLLVAAVGGVILGAHARRRFEGENPAGA